MPLTKPNQTSFVKGKSGNPKGRPKSFDSLRKLAVVIANEIVLDPKTGEPATIEGHTLTRAEMILRNRAQSPDPRKQLYFIEAAFGKVPQGIEMSGPEGKALKIKIAYADADNNGNAPEAADVAEGSYSDGE